MALSREPVGTFAALPDPDGAADVDDLVNRLRLLKVWAGDPSYETIKERVNAAWTAAGRPPSELTRRSTVANTFRPGRRRLTTELVLAVVRALCPDAGYLNRWRRALRVVGGENEAVSQVRVLDVLPQDLAGFSGRTAEWERLRDAAAGGSGAVVVSPIEGMAGVGKTRLAVHAGHRLLRDGRFDRVLFVNLRGFHPDPAEPPADPAAVLDGFLHLLGVPGHQIPYGLDARSAAYRDRLAGTRTLVVLDNAATAEQVRPLLPAGPGCLALVTSRRSLDDLRPATRFTLDVFDPGEAAAFLTGAVPGVPIGPDPAAVARIARHCGHLPLALSLVAGHIRNTPGWTLTDHADRLDERRRDRRLESGVELALDLSYRHLPAGPRRLLRLAALHPGQDFDAYAAAALTGAEPAVAREWLDGLSCDHLVQRAAADRYTLHDLVRAYAAGRAQDEDAPPERRAASTRLFDHYLATAGAAMNTLHPAEVHRRPPITPATTAAPDLSDADRAKDWLATERPTLVAVAAHTAGHGWPGHTTRLAQTLSRYFAAGYFSDSVTVNSHALRAARDRGDVTGEAYALMDLGFAHLKLGRPEPATAHFEQALELFRRAGDPAGQARALHNLSIVVEQSGRYPAAIEYKRQALPLYRQAGDGTGERYLLSSLGYANERMGRLSEAIDYFEQGLVLTRQSGHRDAEALALNGLGEVEIKAGRYESAGHHLQRSLDLYRRIGSPIGEAGVLDSLGLLHTRLGRFDQAIEYHRLALTMIRDLGHQEAEAWVSNGLAEALHAAGRSAEAVPHHTTAGTIAARVGTTDEQARAEAGLGHAHRALGNETQARAHFQEALALYTAIGAPEAEPIRLLIADRRPAPITG